MKQLQGVRNSVAWKLRAAAVCEEELVRKPFHRWGVEAPGSEQRVIQWWTGWWFQTFFIFHNIWDSPSHWLIFFKVVKTTNQWKWWWFDVWLFGDSSNNLYRDLEWFMVSQDMDDCSMKWCLKWGWTQNHSSNWHWGCLRVFKGIRDISLAYNSSKTGGFPPMMEREVNIFSPDIWRTLYS
jgi:hypothetical protein